MDAAPRSSGGSRSRRSFVREGLATVAVFVLVGCSSSKKSIAPRFPVRPDPSESGFGGRIDAGSFEQIRAQMDATDVPYYVPEARVYVCPYPPDAVDRARVVYPKDLMPGLAAGVAVLYQRCTHLGCRVPWCQTSQWFECPCHDAKFDRVGEYRRGPAPRGMDHFPASVEHGRLVIDTGNIHEGTPNGTDTTRQPPAGPFCV